MTTEYKQKAFEVFEFYLEDSSLFEYALTEFGRQPMMRNVAVEYISGEPCV